jgi:hypothetical protein
MNIIEKAVADIGAAIDELTLDPRELVRKRLEGFKLLEYPNAERQRQAAELLKGARNSICELLDNGDTKALRQLLATLTRQCDELTKPIPVPTFREYLAARVKEFQRATWTSEEIDLLVKYGTEHDRITTYDEHGVVLESGALITRLRIREDLRPAWQSLPISTRTMLNFGGSQRLSRP